MVKIERVQTFKEDDPSDPEIWIETTGEVRVSDLIREIRETLTEQQWEAVQKMLDLFGQGEKAAYDRGVKAGTLKGLRLAARTF
jgi:hypothetical protein